MFGRKKKKPEVTGIVKLKPLNYPPKILVGWAEAIAGNKELTDWFLASDQYKELGMAVYAIKLKDEAREWLMQNGYAHLMAMINGVERNKEALHWLEKNNFQTLKHLALAADGDEISQNWLISNGHHEFALVAQKIKIVKDDIEDNHNDVHKFGVD
ncbi:MAG: hypothetical protein ABJG68_10530 [Crocinitomicaceae bacterium]